MTFQVGKKFISELPQKSLWQEGSQRVKGHFVPTRELRFIPQAIKGGSQASVLLSQGDVLPLHTYVHVFKSLTPKIKRISLILCILVASSFVFVGLQSV